MPTRFPVLGLSGLAADHHGLDPRAPSCIIGPLRAKKKCNNRRMVRQETTNIVLQTVMLKSLACMFQDIVVLCHGVENDDRVVPEAP